MLKWFRKYNKILLVVMGSALMVMFLIEPALDMFNPSVASEPMGAIGDEELTLGDQQQADGDLRILQSLSPLLTAGSEEMITPLQWLLMKHEAAGMGISASKQEARQLIRLLGVDERGLAKLAVATDVTGEQIIEAVRDWLAVQQYREMILGLGHLPLEDRLQQVALAAEMLRYGYVPGAMMALQSSRGLPRVSEPLVERFMHDQQASVQIAAVAVKASRYLPSTPDPDEQTLQQLFAEYRDDLPGSSKPYGLGYKYPDRVKLEYLALPAERLAARVDVSEAQALAYYDANPDQFRTTGADNKPGEPKPYIEVRDQVMQQLRRQAAEQLGDRIARAAAALLNEEVRQKSANAMERVAQRIQQQFNVLPDVHRLDQQWLTATSLMALPGIGQSMTPGRQRVPFAAYALAAGPLHAAAQKDQPQAQKPPTDPLAGMHLNLGEPSQPLTAFDGSFYLFSVIDADPTHEPASLDEVREQVARDAKELAAYRALLAERNMWLGRARTESLEDIAEELKTTVITPQSFPRRQFGFQGALEVPSVPPIGRSEAFVDGVFDLVDSIVQETELATATAAQRSGAVAVDDQQTLYLVRIEQFQPMTREEYERMASSPQVLSYVNDMVVEAPKQDPLSVEAISKRVGYQAYGAQKEAEPAVAQ